MKAGKKYTQLIILFFCTMQITCIPNISAGWHKKAKGPNKKKNRPQ